MAFTLPTGKEFSFANMKEALDLQAGGAKPNEGGGTAKAQSRGATGGGISSKGEFGPGAIKSQTVEPVARQSTDEISRLDTNTAVNSKVRGR